MEEVRFIPDFLARGDVIPDGGPLSLARLSQDARCGRLLAVPRQVTVRIRGGGWTWVVR